MTHAGPRAYCVLAEYRRRDWSRVSCFPFINNLQGKASYFIAREVRLWLETLVDSGPECVKKSIKASKLKFASTNLIVVQQRTRPIRKTLAVPGWKYEIGKRIFEHVWSYKTTTTLSHTSGSRRICCTTTISSAALRIQAPKWSRPVSTRLWIFKSAGMNTFYVLNFFLTYLILILTQVVKKVCCMFKILDSMLNLVFWGGTVLSSHFQVFIFYIFTFRLIHHLRLP